MSGDKSCNNCQFWIYVEKEEAYPDTLEARYGLCRRYPPAADQPVTNDFGAEIDTPGGWPMTDGADWCGEHQMWDGFAKHKINRAGRG